MTVTKPTVRGALKPLVCFDDVVGAYGLIDERPGRAMRLAVEHG